MNMPRDDGIIQTYDARADEGFCICGKRGCGQMADMIDTHRHTVIYRYKNGDILEFTCERGHRNQLRI